MTTLKLEHDQLHPTIQQPQPNILNVVIDNDDIDEEDTPHSYTPNNTPTHKTMHSFSPSLNIMHNTLSPIEGNTLSPHVSISPNPPEPNTSINANSMIKYTQQYKQSLKKKNKKRTRTLHVSKSTRKTNNKHKNESKNGRTKISQIEIYDIINDDDLEFKQQLTEEKSIHTKQFETEINFNKSILEKAKRPYYILIFITVLCIGVFVMNFIDILRYWTLDGLTPSVLNLAILIPLWICFRYFENKITFQYNVIGTKIAETYDLNKKLQSKIDQHLLEKKKNKQYRLTIKEQEIEIQKLKLELNNYNQKHFMNNSNGKDKQINFNKLLHGFRNGQMEIQIEFADKM
eukprot:219179_1